MTDRGPERSGRRRVWFAGKEGIRIALDSLRASRLRTGLTILGVAVGVGVVVFMAALVTGIRGSVQEEIEAAGPSTFFVTRFDLSDVQLVQDGSGRPPWWNRPPVSVDEARRVNQLPAVRSAVLNIELQDPGAEGGLTVEFGGTRITGVAGAAAGAEWPEYRRVTFREGRNFAQAEVEAASSVVVLSRQLATDLFGEEEAIGRRVRVTAGGGERVPLRVLGVVEVAENLFEDGTAHLAMVPLHTALRRLGVPNEWGQLIVVPRDEASQEVAEDQVIGLLRSMRGLGPDQESDFTILRSTQLMELFDEFTGVFFVVLLALSSVALLVGGVGVVGIMLIAVTERTREIGIRKVAGASRSEIMWQFLVEASVLTLLGGAIGLAGGAGLAHATAILTPIPAAVPLWAALAALVMAAATGLLFGLLPALRAARMDPVSALGYE